MKLLIRHVNDGGLNYSFLLNDDRIEERTYTEKPSSSKLRADFLQVLLKKIGKTAITFEDFI